MLRKTILQLAQYHERFVWALNSNNLLAPLVLFGLFSIGIFKNIHLPCIYWDAVNPDYLAAKILAGSNYISNFPPWDAFPVLGNWYHGVMHTYFGLIFFNIFGFSVFSLRVAHAVFGFAILLISHTILSKGTGSRAFSLLFMGIFALDPAFVFAFRTQNYITMSPAFFLLFSVYLLLTVSVSTESVTTPRAGSKFIWSGVFAGWSFYGYFIYIFFLPAFLVMIAMLSKKFSRSFFQTTLVWLIGFATGAFLYFYGYAGLLVEYKGFSEFAKHASDLKIAGNQISILDRPYLSVMNAMSSLSGDYQYGLIFGEKKSPTVHGTVKLTVLIILSAIPVVVLFRRKLIDDFHAYILLLIFSFFLVSLFFGTRLAPHHMIPLLPLLYIAVGIGLYRVGDLFSNFVNVKKIAAIVLVITLFILAALNLQHQNIFQTKLLETGGVNYYSDSQTLLAEGAMHDPKPSYYVFQEWGFSGSFAFLTAGKVPFNSSLDDWAISRVPCNRDLVFVFWGLSNPLVESFAINHGHIATRRVFYQRDGAVSFTSLTVNDRLICLATDNRLVF